MSLLFVTALPGLARAQSAEHVEAVASVRAAAAGQVVFEALYGPRRYEMLWFDDRGRVTQSADDALRLIHAAADDGLEPRDYAVAEIALERARLSEPRADVAVEQKVRFDLALSAAMLRYFRDVHAGRVDSDVAGLALSQSRDPSDYAWVLREAAAAGDLLSATRALRPKGGQYEALAGQLARYRALARRGDAAGWNVDLPREALRIGDRLEAAAALWRYLQALGDAPAGVPPGGVYDGRVADAVRRFQERHGLEPDGVIGAATRAALLVPLAWRVRQIELAMERQRWLPWDTEARLIVVDVPMYQLSVWDALVSTRVPVLRSRVIVGARRTPTPTLSAVLTEVVFRPYWNVPSSIVIAEILPALVKEPAYLSEHDMELVAGQREDAPVVGPTRANLARLRRGDLRLRQRRGPKNALGLIKFTFPNAHDVYMHDTPARRLFAAARRDFSHGCIRVEHPAALAEWLLRGEPGFDRDGIRAAMNGPGSSRVPPSRPTRVVLLHVTASVRAESGAIHFADDLYGEDERLDRALRDGAAARVTVVLPGSGERHTRRHGHQERTS